MQNQGSEGTLDLIEGAEEQSVEVRPGRNYGAAPGKNHPAEIAGTHCDHGMGSEPGTIPSPIPFQSQSGARNGADPRETVPR